MSMHLVECVRALDLPPSHKLALVAFADSGDTDSRLAMPGFDAVQQWAGVSRSRTFELISDLKEWGYVRQESAGRSGRRATYTVFPTGCCELHREVLEEISTNPDESLQAALAALTASGVELTDEQRRAFVTAGSGTSDPDDRGDHEPAGQDDDSAARVQPAGPYPPTAAQGPTQGPAQIGPSASGGSDQGPAQGGPLPSFKNIPLTPSEAGGTEPLAAKCPKHPAGDGVRCRPCGTTPRQLAAAAKKAAAAERRRRHLEDQARAQQEREAKARRTDDVDPAVRETLRASVRAARTGTERAAS
ncbi:hypothetical protein ACOACO_17585 [Nocardioides sp. CPCC 205120]|uniref:hypothetical protein n=1 Tax=Nocardioides sp. CPCC 205120 TaxID=3406462 RepID=UPI003B500736